VEASLPRLTVDPVTDYRPPLPIAELFGLEEPSSHYQSPAFTLGLAETRVWASATKIGPRDRLEELVNQSKQLGYTLFGYQIVAGYFVDPYGVPAAYTDSNEVPDPATADYESIAAAGNTIGGRFPGGQNLLFQGTWTDPVTGISYARARWYDARNAGWLSEDPVGDKDSPNLYSFVASRPHASIDPMGLHDFVKRTINGLEFDLAVPTIDEIRKGELALSATFVSPLSGAQVNMIVSPHEGDMWAFMAKMGSPLAKETFEDFYGVPASEVEVSAFRLWARGLWHHKEDLVFATIGSIAAMGNMPKPKPKIGTSKPRFNLARNNTPSNSSTTATANTEASATKANTNTSTTAQDAQATRPGTQQPKGGNGRVLSDGEGATQAEIAESTGGPTGGSRAGQSTIRQRLIDEAEGEYLCWRCGQTSTNQSNMHLGHRNVPTSQGGNLSDANVCLEGASCNLSAGNRGAPKAGRSCADRGSCGAPYGRND
jgi:RHS repeat-associated protein